MYELYLIIFQYLFRSGLDPFVHAAEPSLKLEKNLAQKNITVKYLKDTDKGNLYLLHLLMHSYFHIHTFLANHSALVYMHAYIYSTYACIHTYIHTYIQTTYQYPNGSSTFQVYIQRTYIHIYSYT